MDKKPAMVTLDCREKSAAVSCGGGSVVVFWCDNCGIVAAVAGVVLPPKPKTRLASEAAGEKKPDPIRDVLRGSGGKAGLAIDDDVFEEEEEDVASSTKAGLLLLPLPDAVVEVLDQDNMVAGVTAETCRRP